MTGFEVCGIILSVGIVFFLIGILISDDNKNTLENIQEKFLESKKEILTLKLELMEEKTKQMVLMNKEWSLKNQLNLKQLNQDFEIEHESAQG